MTVQIAVRLPEETVAFVDALIADGTASSRAQVVARALERERRRRVAEADAAIYVAINAAGGTDEAELDQLAARAAATPMPDLD